MLDVRGNEHMVNYFSHPSHISQIKVELHVQEVSVSVYYFMTLFSGVRILTLNLLNGFKGLNKRFGKKQRQV